MKVKKYTANSMHEAMKVIRSELGDDAVILNSKEVDTGGFLGFFTKKKMEVIAAIDPAVSRAPIRKTTSNVVRSRKADVVSPVTPQKEEPTQEQLMKEINQLKELVQGLNDKNSSVNKEYPEPFQQIDDQLRVQGITETIRFSIMKHLLKQWYDQSTSKRNQQEIKIELYNYLQSLLANVPIGGISFNKKILNLVGPTGVGKTTTIAKLAADSVLKKKKKVALITTDTYRIAAVEQLKTYAKILNIPLEVAYSIEDFKKAIEQFKHYDLILVDSAGRNFRNQLYVEELSKVIDFEQDADTYLVLSLTSKYEDMKKIIGQFHLIPLHQVILTKHDETSTYGAMLNIPIDLGKGVAYVTTGQNVPDDIVEVTSEYLLSCVLEVKINE
ncbi:flagellar biosynthesis protein FlhF [Halalkalibacter alkaliphilus]|uniref:Flagellar biosynthesis protein FlhF n=1 Tax=Halalkalibacter alkaliphilus TaxID=2917993 RepID=A0A9X2A0I3_9BACI|nr:flagellar biosynthesis protein FlhF [Halalkalibacter alkaliphilus]MCL7746485.1 flagellar biosynthesis protein FlhF [Halalkalibacter alkaliphilus]